MKRIHSCLSIDPINISSVWHMKGSTYVICYILLAFFFSYVGSVGAKEENPTTIKIGVLAGRGPEQCMAQWSPTAEYLTEVLPGTRYFISFKAMRITTGKHNVIDTLPSQPCCLVTVSSNNWPGITHPQYQTIHKPHLFKIVRHNTTFIQ